MVNLSEYEGKPEHAELVDEIKRLRAIADQFAEVSEMMTAPSEPIRNDVIRCGEICRERARRALEAYRSM
jgi:hypothetical protein